MADIKKQDPVVCDQCGEEITKDDDRVIFALNKGFHLCSSCAQELVLNERHKNENSIKKGKRLTPAAIKEFLDRYVIGQDNAKIILSLAVYNHYKRIRYAQQHKDNKDYVEIEKTNCLMLGRTGQGKTYLLKNIARFLNVPFVIEDANNFSASGSIIFIAVK